MHRNLASEFERTVQRGRRGTGSSLRRPPGLADAALEKALHCVARISSEVGHELNNQLAVILNYTYVLARRLPDAPDAGEHITEMRRAVWHASDLASQLRHFGLAQRTTAETTRLSDLLTELEPVLLHGLDPDRELDIRMDEDLHPVAIARGPLESMLLRAALIKHRSPDPGGCLAIHAYNAERTVTDPDGQSATHPYVQLEVGPLPAAWQRRPAPVDQTDATTAGQLMSDRVRAGLAELGAELEIREEQDSVHVTLWLPAVV